MKKFNIITFALMNICIMVFSCQENEYDIEYRDVDRLLLTGDPEQGAVADSVAYSFAVQSDLISETELSLIVNLMGTPSEADREFILEIDNSSTAEAGEYELPSSFILPAGKVSMVIPVLVKRTSRLENAIARLTLRIVPNNNFQAGPLVPGSGNNPNAGPSFSIVWTDQLIKPVTWDTGGLGFYAGTYSKAKHKLIVDATEHKDLDTVAGQYNTIFYIVSRALEDLTEYNMTHEEPLKREDGVPIGICTGCD